jgi:hypothetical protein
VGEIATIRKRRSRDYTTLGNELLRDERLSWKARGLFCYLWSHSDNFRFSVNKLTSKAADGRDSTSSGLTELQKYGYLAIEWIRGPKGRFSRAVWLLTEDPVLCDQTTQSPQPENPDAVVHRERETGIPVKPSRTTEVPLVRTTTTTDTTPATESRSSEVVVVEEVRISETALPACDLVPPQSLISDDQREAIELVHNLPLELAQQVLDEIEGGLRVKRVENWRGLLHTLITRGFTPNRCRAIEGERRRRAEDDRAAKLRSIERANRQPVDPERRKVLVEKARAEIFGRESSIC